MNFPPKKSWSARGLDKFIKKIEDTGGTDRTNGSGSVRRTKHQCRIMNEVIYSM